MTPEMKKKFDWEMYRYIPSLAGAISSMIIFTVLTALHSWQWWRTRTHIIVWVIVGAACEVSGYGARIGSHYDPKAWAPFIIQGTLTLVGPLFLAATIYMMLGRTIRIAGGDNVSIVKPKWCTRVFVGADVSTLVLQGLGASIMGTMKLHLALAGEKVVIAGLALQVATFVTFVVVATHFHIRMNNEAQYASHRNTSAQWRKMLWILYSVSSLILVRCIFRLIEYSMGNASYLISHEWTLYVFDAAPMVLVLVLMLILQPASYVTQENGPQKNGTAIGGLTTAPAAPAVRAK